MKPLNSTIAAIALLGAAATSAVAMPGQPVFQACAADAQKLCPGLTPGDHMLGRCMHDHKEQVSQGCKDAFKAAHDAHKVDGGGQRPGPGGPGGHGGPRPRTAASK